MNIVQRVEGYNVRCLVGYCQGVTLAENDVPACALVLEV